MQFLTILAHSGMIAESLEVSLSDWFHLSLFDLLFVVTALAFNVQVIGIYLAARQRQMEVVRIFGAMTILLALPFLIVFLYRTTLGQESWQTAGFLAIFFYLALELVADFIYQSDFRRKPALHIPYIILFYIVEFFLIAMAFSIAEVSGYLVSASFWALLLVLVFSLRSLGWQLRPGG